MILLLALLAFGFILPSTPVWAAARELDDAEMDEVHAGNSRKSTSAKAPANSAPTSISTDNSTSSVAISGQAQQNLSSLVNIVAVNSAVQVLMNVNVAINSQVSSVSQGNGGAQTHRP